MVLACSEKLTGGFLFFKGIESQYFLFGSRDRRIEDRCATTRMCDKIEIYFDLSRERSKNTRVFLFIVDTSYHEIDEITRVDFLRIVIELLYFYRAFISRTIEYFREVCSISNRRTVS